MRIGLASAYWSNKLRKRKTEKQWKQPLGNKTDKRIGLIFDNYWEMPGAVEFSVYVELEVQKKTGLRSLTAEKIQQGG